MRWSLTIKYIDERKDNDMMQELVDKLLENRQEIATMESCTGGALASEITSVEGASEILKFSAVTYSNEYKIKMGVSEEVIDKYSVYSRETAREMSRSISSFANSDIGVGITGKLNCADSNNPYGKDNIVHISIYFKNKDSYYDYEIKVIKESRMANKELVVASVIAKLLELLSE